MVRFRDAALEAAVQRTSERGGRHGVGARRPTKHRVAVNGRTRLLNTSASTRQFELGDWLGRHRVPGRVAQEPVTVVRSVNGTGLACAPSVSPRRFSDPTLEQGEDGSALLAVLAAFERPTTVDSALAKLRSKARLDPELRARGHRPPRGRTLPPAPSFISTSTSARRAASAFAGLSRSLSRSRRIALSAS